MIGDLAGRVFSSQVYSPMLVSWCFLCIFRLEAACCTCICVVLDDIAFLEVFADIHKSIESQQPILLQKIDYLKHV